MRRPARTSGRCSASARAGAGGVRRAIVVGAVAGHAGPPAVAEQPLVAPEGTSRSSSRITTRRSRHCARRASSRAAQAVLGLAAGVRALPGRPSRRAHGLRAAVSAKSSVAGREWARVTAAADIVAGVRAARTAIVLCAIALVGAVAAPSASAVVPPGEPIARWTCAAPGLVCQPCPVHCTSPTGKVAPGVPVSFDGLDSSDDRPDDPTPARSSPGSGPSATAPPRAAPRSATPSRSPARTR